MPKLIDYPRTSYAGAWEVADVVDDTGGKCALDTCARKLNRKVSGSFKAIVGSAVKFGLLTSKRELLTTTTLFRRIKHAYDKQEELLFHREAFLTPPLFTQLCRKFRSRELPVQMLDIMLIREFDVEEINAQSVAKAFVDGARMVGLLDERNTIADIDQLAAQQLPRRELASPELGANSFRAEISRATAATQATSDTATLPHRAETPPPVFATAVSGSTKLSIPAAAPEPSPSSGGTLAAPALRGRDAVASLFGLAGDQPAEENKPAAPLPPTPPTRPSSPVPNQPIGAGASTRLEPALNTSAKPGVRTARQPEETLAATALQPTTPLPSGPGTAAGPPIPPVPSLPLPSGGFRIELSGPGLNTVLDVQDEDDLALARGLLDKIGRQLKK